MGFKVISVQAIFDKKTLLQNYGPLFLNFRLRSSHCTELFLFLNSGVNFYEK